MLADDEDEQVMRDTKRRESGETERVESRTMRRCQHLCELAGSKSNEY